MATTARLFATISLPLAAAGALNQINRAITALIAPDLAQVFGLSGADLGLLGAMLFAAYGLAQLPVGAALDRYGPRRVQTALMGVIAAGALLFALAQGLGGLLVARVLIGAGVSAALMAQLKATREWFPADRIATIAGWCAGLSSMGGMVATVPAALLVDAIGWRGVFVVIAGLSLAAGCVIWTIVPEHPGARQAGSLADQARTIGHIMSHPDFIRLVPAIAVISALTFVWQGLWAGPWLRDVAGLEAGSRAWVLLLYAAGLTLGSFLSGSIQATLVRRGAHPLTMLVVCACGLLVMHVLLISGVVARFPLLWVLWPFLASIGPVAYTIVSARFPASMTGRVSTAINASMLVLVFAGQHGIGLILDLWPRTATGGWDRRGYAAALTVSALIQAASLAWLLLRREKAAAGASP